MAHNVLVNVDKTVVGGTSHKVGDVVVVNREEYAALQAAGRFSGGSPVLTDQGETNDAAAPTALVALTSAAAAGATPTKAEFDALRTDLVNTRTYLTALKTALTGEGLPF